MKIEKVIIFTLIYSLFFSCTKKEDRDQSFIPPLKINISNQIKENQDLYFQIISVENSINELSDNIENTAISGKLLINKKQEDLTILEGLETTKIMLSFYSNSNQIKNTIDEFDEFINEKKSCGTLNNEIVKELELISNKFKQRVKLLNKKYKEFYSR
jgi:hypothetical protein